MVKRDKHTNDSHTGDQPTGNPAAADEWGSPRNAPVPVSGPSGLSDYAVSPLGTPLALLGEEVRVAFVGRTSTEDQQDPRASVVRQLGNCKAAIPDTWVIVAHFYDVESGRMSLDQRGRAADLDRFEIPIARDGGIADLLAQATDPGRGWDVVITESMARIARRAYEGLTVERALEDAGVPLFASNEPISLSGARSQRVLQRRINQSVAEYEVLNTLEQSWGGLCTHTRDGYNIGKPCYGYKAKLIRHPNPAKAARGQTKMRLEPDGVRAETVTQIARWRHQGAGLTTIVDRLNADPTRYPPPEPPGGPGRARGAWCKTSIHEILRNPKYTGFMVFNRRASRSKRGKVNDPRLWVWSPAPTHEPLIAKWMYDELRATAARHTGSRDGDTTNTHPATRRSYVLRGMVLCHCGRRMGGKHRYRRGTDQTWYECYPRANNRANTTGRTQVGEIHPRSTYLSEPAVLDAIARFYADRVFGPHRAAALRADLDGVDDRAAAQRQQERERLGRVVDDLTRRQAALMRRAQTTTGDQDDDEDDEFARELRRTYNELGREKKTALAAITDLDTTDQGDPQRQPHPDDIALLDALPTLRVNLAAAPETLLRRLFEATRLSVTLHNPQADRITITATLTGDELPEVANAAHATADAEPDQPSDQQQYTPGLSPMPYVPPVGLEPTLNGV